jgi:hypothetical protein
VPSTITRVVSPWVIDTNRMNPAGAGARIASPRARARSDAILARVNGLLEPATALLVATAARRGE